MPQFEIEPTGHPPQFVRARSETDALARVLEGAAPVLEDAEPGSGWQTVTVEGEVWGRVRPRDRMRFRRD